MASQKYSVEEVVELMKSDEPIFIVRAQDQVAMGTMAFYINHLLHVYQRTQELAHLSEEEFGSLIEGLIQTQRSMGQWQVSNLHKVKYPTP